MPEAGANAFCYIYYVMNFSISRTVVNYSFIAVGWGVKHMFFDGPRTNLGGD